MPHLKKLLICGILLLARGALAEELRCDLPPAPEPVTSSPLAVDTTGSLILLDNGYLYDRQALSLEQVNVSTAGESLPFTEMQISDDARYAAFGPLYPGLDQALYFRDRLSGTTRTIEDNAGALNLTADGKILSFVSYIDASNGSIDYFDIPSETIVKNAGGAAGFGGAPYGTVLRRDGLSRYGFFKSWITNLSLIERNVDAEGQVSFSQGAALRVKKHFLGSDLIIPANTAYFVRSQRTSVGVRYFVDSANGQSRPWFFAAETPSKWAISGNGKIAVFVAKGVSKTRSAKRSHRMLVAANLETGAIRCVARMPNKQSGSELALSADGSTLVFGGRLAGNGAETSLRVFELQH